MKYFYLLLLIFISCRHGRTENDIIRAIEKVEKQELTKDGSTLEEFNLHGISVVEASRSRYFQDLKSNLIVACKYDHQLNLLDSSKIKKDTANNLVKVGYSLHAKTSKRSYSYHVYRYFYSEELSPYCMVKPK